MALLGSPLEPLDGLRPVALDPVAYVRFVSVYRSFDSVQEFAHLLHEMEKAAQSSPEGQRNLFEIDARGQIHVPPRPDEVSESVREDMLPETGGEPGDAT